MRKIQLCLLVLTAVFATGCPKYRPKVDFKNPEGFVNQLNEHIKTTQHNYECYLFGPSYPSPLGSCANFVQNADTAKAIRNELLENALPFIDSAYDDFINDLQAGRDRTNFIADVIDLGAAAAVGITNGERALQIIGVALTAFRGGRKSADANFYKDQSTPILISKMDDSRAKVRATILINEEKPATGYPLGRAVSDIVKYYNAGSLVRAFQQLENDTAAATQASEAHLKNLMDAGVKGAPTAAEFAASQKNADDIRALRSAYATADKNVKDADAKTNTAVQNIATAVAAVTTADQNIGAASARITAAATAAANSQAKADKLKAEADKTQAEADKTKAEGEKAKAEGDKSKAEAAKTTGDGEKAAAVAARDQAFKNLRGVYDAIAADPKLGPELNKVADNPDLVPNRRTTLQAMLQRNKSRPLPAGDAERDTAVNEYSTILFEFAQMVVARFTAEPELNNRLREIIKANQ